MSRTLRLLTLVSFSLAPLALAGCGGTVIEVEARVGTRELDLYFQDAAIEFGVPAALLKAIGFVETRFYDVPGENPEIEGMAPAFGVMALRGEQLTRGARLAGVSEDDAISLTRANIFAAAALLSSYADEQGLAPEDRKQLGAWAKVVARWSEIPSDEGQASYIHDQVYRVLRDGLDEDEAEGLRATLAAHGEIEVDFPKPEIMPGDRWPDGIHSGAIWRPAPSSNYTSGRGGNKVSLLVVHTCAGGYSGCWGWLTTPYPRNPYYTSAHYVVNESGSEISALVDENNTAHHVGARWQGLPTNSRSVGIEHGGFPFQGGNRWTDGQVATSARLACDVVKRHGIIRDRNHIIGHYQPDPVNRPSDPGRDFPWADYMARIDRCVGAGGGGGGGGGGGVPPGAITVDSNNARNDQRVARMLAPSGNWTASTNVGGFYGSGYWVAPTAAVSDGAHFEFYLPAAANKAVYAWWTAAYDRAPAAPYVIFNAQGQKLGSVQKNQQRDGGGFRYLGNFNFTAGWNRVTLSRWTQSGYQVVADAIQVR